MTGIELISKPSMRGFVINKPGSVVAVPVNEDGTLDWENSIRNTAVINTITVTNTRTKTDILDGNNMYKAGDRITGISGTLAIEFSDIDLAFWGMAAGDGPNVVANDTMVKLFESTRIKEGSNSLVFPYKYKEGTPILITGNDGTKYTKLTSGAGTKEVITVTVGGTGTVSADGVATLTFDDGVVKGTITADVKSADDKTAVATKLAAGKIDEAITEVYDVELDTTTTSSPKIVFTAKVGFTSRTLSMATPITYSGEVTGPTGTAAVSTQGVAATVGEDEFIVTVTDDETVIQFNEANANKVVSGQFIYETETVSYSQGKKTMAYHKFFIDHSWSDLGNKQNFDVNIEISQAAMGADMVDTLSKDPSTTKTLTFDIYAPLEGEQPYTLKINPKGIDNK